MLLCWANYLFNPHFFNLNNEILIHDLRFLWDNFILSKFLHELSENQTSQIVSKLSIHVHLKCTTSKTHINLNRYVKQILILNFRKYMTNWINCSGIVCRVMHRSLPLFMRWGNNLFLKDHSFVKHLFLDDWKKQVAGKFIAKALRKIRDRQSGSID